MSQTETEVELKKPNAQTIRVAKSKLSAADREFLATLKPAPISNPKIQAPADTKQVALDATPAAAGNKESKKLEPSQIEALRKKFFEPPKLPTFVLEHEIPSGSKSQPRVRVSKNGKLLATADFIKRKVKTWDLETGKEIDEFDISPMLPHCCALSPGGNYFVYGDRKQQVVVYDLINKREHYVHKAAATAEQKLLQVAINWSETEVYFMTKNGSFYRFPIGGGQGNSVTLPLKKDNSNSQQPFDVSSDGESISAITNEHPVLTFKLPLPQAANKDPKPPILLPQTEDMSLIGCPLNNGVLTFDRFSFKRQGFLIRYQTPYGSKQISDKKSLVPGVSRLQVSEIAVDRTEDYAWVLGAAPHHHLAVDIFDLNGFGSPVTVSIPKPAGASISDLAWLCPDAKRVIRYGVDSRNFHVYKLSEFESPPLWLVHATFRDCLLKEDYDAIDSLVQPLLNSQQPFPNSSSSPAIEEIVSGFFISQSYEDDSDWHLRLRRWMLTKPESVLARLVVARSLISQAFAARGSKPAAAVPEEGMRVFKKLGVEADRILAPLMELPTPPAIAFTLQLKVALINSWDLEKQMDLADQLAKVIPDYQPFHNQLMMNLLPRWSGEEQACEKYASLLAERLGQDKGEMAYGRLAMILTNYTRPENFVEETGMDFERAFKGLLLADKNNPNDNSTPLMVEAFLLYSSNGRKTLLNEENKGEYEAAAANFDKLIKTDTWNHFAQFQYPFIEYVLQGKFIRSRRAFSDLAQ